MSKPQIANAPDQIAAAPTRLGPAQAAAGDAASSEAVGRLKRAVEDLRQQAAGPLLHAAVDAIRTGDWAKGGEWALKALEVDERSGLGWWLLAICREKAGDFRNAIACYESALQLLPEHADIANDLGRLAYRLDQKEVAAKLFARFLVHRPGHPEGANNLACALRDQERYDEAVEALRTVLYANPEIALLWNTLGTILNEQGEVETSVTFYEEALRLEPGFARARYNRGNARLALGDAPGALEDVDAALPGAEPGAEAGMMRLARASMLVACGELGAGWDEYEVRLDPQFSGVTHFMVDRPRWTPDSDVRGKSVLLVGEQGLGDEILFANVVPDLLEAIGPEGRLTLAVEHRQVKLFQQSFPEAVVGAHATYKVDGHIVRTLPFLENDLTGIDLWTPMASVLRRWRRSVDAYPSRERFMAADPARVAFWKARLAELGDGPKVGLLWKSMKLDSARRRYFSPFEQWRPVLETPGARFVNLQYGDCSAELEQARGQGFDIWNPPGIDLKDDLDDVAALSCALDLVIGPANATSNIAAACGASVWLISVPGAWTKLGTDRYPWYPQARVFNPPALNRWEPVMADVAEALRTAF
jgi:cytochrome c-type biogenesis protein CcmH/NrfG